MLPWKLRKRQILLVSQNLSSLYFSLAKFQLVSCNLSLAIIWQMTYPQKLPKLCSATLTAEYWFIPVDSTIQRLNNRGLVPIHWFTTDSRFYCFPSSLSSFYEIKMKAATSMEQMYPHSNWWGFSAFYSWDQVKRLWQYRQCIPPPPPLSEFPTFK